MLRLALGSALGLTIFASLCVAAVLVYDHRQDQQAQEREERRLELVREREAREQEAVRLRQEAAARRLAEWEERDREWRAANRRQARIDAARQRRQLEAKLKKAEAARQRVQAGADAAVRRSEACSRGERTDC